MTTMSYKLTTAFFDSKGLKYLAREEDSAMLLLYGMKDNKRLDILINFDEDDRTAGLTTFGYLTFPEEKKAAMYELCSKMNGAYRWVKFYVDDENCEIRVRDDAVIQLDSCGEEIHELVGRLIEISEDAYPNFMKAIWS
ncbi:MAG: YbjN domain-containing protein [Lachnospiraceae bacterium]|nr:YbjN domain-containing protein [Lachnospiraceae bacterium]